MEYSKKALYKETTYEEVLALVGLEKLKAAKTTLTLLLDGTAEKLPDEGLCYVLTWSAPAVGLLASLWEKYSNSLMYPVPHPEAPGDPVAASALFNDVDNLWKGRYGDLRMELAVFLLQCIEELLSDYTPAT